MAGAVQHQGSGHGMAYSHRGTRNAGGGERAVTFSLQPCDRSSSTCSSSSRSTLQAEDESSDYDVPISLADHRQLLDKAFLDSAVFDTDLHIEESDSESSEIASALLDFSVLDDGPEGDYDVPGRAVAVDSAYDSTMVADDLDETPTPSRGVTFDLQQESTYDVPTSCILGVADRAVNLPEVESQATDETDAGYSTDSPGMGSKFYDGAITKSFSKDVSDVIPKEVLEFMEGRGHVSLDIPEEAPIDLRMVLEDVGLSVPGEDSLSVSVGTPECARDSLVVSIDEGMESPTVEEKQFKSAKKGYIQDPPVVMKAGQKGNKMTKRAAVMRNRSVRKSIKELYVFRCSTFVDMLYFNTITEVCKALNKTRGLYQRWLELQEEPGNVLASREELEWTNTELRNATRSIDWDLEDLEETIGIVEKNPRKFKIDGSELASRRAFIDQTKEEVKSMKERLNLTKRDRDVTARQPVGEDSSPLKMPQVVTHGNTRYSRLVNEEAESPNNEYIEQTLSQQQMLMSQQDDQLDHIASSMGTLKNMSRQIGSEVDEQAVMLDDFGHEMDNTQSKMENTLSKMAKVMHLSSDRRQWAAMGALTGVLAIVVILFFIL